jgi:hypothetical protein
MFDKQIYNKGLVELAAKMAAAGRSLIRTRPAFGLAKTETARAGSNIPKDR